MAKKRPVYIVECRDYDNPHRMLDTVQSYVASTEAKALEFIKDNPDYGGQILWWWAVSREYIDVDPHTYSNQVAFYDKYGHKIVNQPAPPPKP